MKITEYTKGEIPVTLHLVRLGYEYLLLKNITKNIEKLVKFRDWCPLMFMNGRGIVKSIPEKDQG